MENKNDIRDINKLREEIYDIISDSIAWGDTECVVAIEKNDGKFGIFTDFEKNIDKDAVVEFLPVDKLIRVGEDGNEEPDNDAIDEVANKWIANFSCFSKRDFSLSKKFEIRGLRNCLRKYEEKGKYATSGKWSIATGGYDLYWQLYYEEEPLIDNVCNELTVDNRYDYSNLNEVISIILEEYKNVNISSEESRELFYELGDSEVDFFCGRKSLDEHKKLLDYNKKFFRDNNEVIGYYEQTIKRIEGGFDEFGQSYKDCVKMYEKDDDSQKFEVGDIVEDKFGRYLISDICVCDDQVGDYDRFWWNKCYILKKEDGSYTDSISGHYVKSCDMADVNFVKVGTKNNFNMENSNTNKLQEIWNNEMKNEPVLETENGVIYIQPSKDGKNLEYGSVMNAGMAIQGTYEYDFDRSLDENLQQVAEKIYAENNNVDFDIKLLSEGTIGKNVKPKFLVKEYENEKIIQLIANNEVKVWNFDKNGKFLSFSIGNEEFARYFEFGYSKEGFQAKIKAGLDDSDNPYLIFISPDYSNKCYKIEITDNNDLVTYYSAGENDWNRRYDEYCKENFNDFNNKEIKKAIKGFFALCDKTPITFDVLYKKLKSFAEENNFSMYFFDKNGKPSERKSTGNSKKSERRKPTLTFWF